MTYVLSLIMTGLVLLMIGGVCLWAFYATVCAAYRTVDQYGFARLLKNAQVVLLSLCALAVVLGAAAGVGWIAVRLGLPPVT